MPDDKPPQPPEKPTVKDLDRVPQWAIALTEKVQSGIATLRADISLVANDLDVLKGRVGNLETARATDEARATANSIKVRAVSESNMTQDAELAKERAAREELAARVDSIESMVKEVRDAVTGFFTNKKVIFVGKTLFGLAMAYAAAKGFRVLP